MVSPFKGFSETRRENIAAHTVFVMCISTVLRFSISSSSEALYNVAFSSYFKSFHLIDGYSLIEEFDHKVLVSFT